MPYLDNMADGLAASDIVIGSAGAISLAEITALGKPSIIIPKSLYSRKSPRIQC